MEPGFGNGRQLRQTNMMSSFDMFAGIRSTMSAFLRESATKAIKKGHPVRVLAD
jgi:hypothetical protein